MKKSILSNIIYIILIIMLVIGVICLFLIPTIYNSVIGEVLPKFEEQTIYYKIAFYTCYIISLGILYNLMCLFKKIYKDSPFKKDIEVILKVIATLFMALFLIVSIKSIFIPTMLTFAVMIITFMVSLSFYVLSQVIKSAIAYKSELDLTV